MLITEKPKMRNLLCLEIIPLHFPPMTKEVNMPLKRDFYFPSHLSQWPGKAKAIPVTGCGGP
jgi:hypothetical protein